MSNLVAYHLEWHKDKVIRHVQHATREATRDGALAVMKEMESRVPIDQGDLLDTINMRESIYEDGGWIVGIFAQPTPRWIDSMSARAVFVEYGHAARGRGRQFVKRSAVFKHIPAQPFMRPALDAAGGKIKSSFHNRIK